jgi:hypothetical protein
LDAYATLGVPEDASIETIQVAYRRLVFEHHPDTRVSSLQGRGADSRPAPRCRAQPRCPPPFSALRAAGVLGTTHALLRYTRHTARCATPPGGSATMRCATLGPPPRSAAPIPASGPGRSPRRMAAPTSSGGLKSGCGVHSASESGCLPCSGSRQPAATATCDLRLRQQQWQQQCTAQHMDSTAHGQHSTAAAQACLESGIAVAGWG